MKRSFFVLTLAACCLSRLWRDPAFKYFLIVVAGLLATSAAYAAELPTGVFQMRDGMYFHPTSGLVTSNLNDILMHVSSTQTATSTTAPSALKFAIKRAQELLSATSTAPSVASSDDGWRTVTLAIWDPAAPTSVEAIRIVTLEKNGMKLRELANPIVGIRVARSNGANSEFSVATGEMIVAVRYPIYRERKISAKKIVYDVSDIIYTPYARALHTPEMIAEGKQWLDQTVAGVFEELRREGIPSRVSSNRLVADVIDPEFVKRILLVEHLDENALQNDARRQIEALFVTLGANEDRAFTVAKSKAGALGLAQFIPKTYAALVRWPHLHLEQNFEKGMRDPKNAIRAEVAYLDYLLSRLPDEIHASSMPRERVEEIVAASYNGGATRAASAMKAWEENLDPSQRLHVKSRSRLKLETMKYVLKLRALRRSANLP